MGWKCLKDMNKIFDAQVITGLKKVLWIFVDLRCVGQENQSIPHFSNLMCLYAGVKFFSVTR